TNTRAMQAARSLRQRVNAGRFEPFHGLWNFRSVCDLGPRSPNMPRILPLFVLVLGLAHNPAMAAGKARPTLTPQVVNDAQWRGTKSAKSGTLLLKAHVLLDRAGFSPGAIDARGGENFDKALRAFQQAHGLDSTGKLDQTTWDELIQTSNEPVLRSYTTTAA